MVLIESTKELMKDLKIRFIHKKPKDNSNQLSITSLEDKLIRLKYSSLSADQNKKILNEIIVYIKEKHNKSLTNEIFLKKLEFTNEIDSLDRLLKFENQKISDSSDLLNIEIDKINQTNEFYLNTLKSDDLNKNEITYTQNSIHDNEIFKFKLFQDLQKLRNSKEVFNIKELKISIFNQLKKLESVQTIQTKQIGKINTSIEKPPIFKMTFIGFLGGFLLGLSFVLVSYSTSNHYRNTNQL